MSLDITLTRMQPTDVFSRNITHNLVNMAQAAGLYKAMWRPETLGVTKAGNLLPHLETGLALLLEDKARFEAFNPSNGWGDYSSLVEFVKAYIQACISNPDASIGVSR